MGRDAQLIAPPNGTVLLTHSPTLIGAIIRIFTLAWFRWNHAAAVVWIGVDPWVYEVTTQVSRPDGRNGQVKPGIRAERWKHWIAAQTDPVWVTHAKAWSRKSWTYTTKWEEFWDSLWRAGVGYDYEGAVMAAAPGDIGPNPKATFCSAAVVHAFHYLGLGSSKTADWWEWTPADIARSSLFTKPRRIK